MNVIEKIIEILKQNKQVRYEFRTDAIHHHSPIPNTKACFA
jgi:hypothetical protein